MTMTNSENQKFVTIDDREFSLSDISLINDQIGTYFCEFASIKLMAFGSGKGRRFRIENY